MSNVRTQQQAERMEEADKKGTCYLCDRVAGEHNIPFIHEGVHWIIVLNDFPYAPDIHHYMIVTKKHVTKVTELFPEEWLECLEMLKWIENKTNVAGYSFFVRNGDTHYTGATLTHLHFHFLSGNSENESSEPVRVKLAHKKTLVS